MTDMPSIKKPRAVAAATVVPTSGSGTATATKPSKLDQLEALLRAPGGASLVDLMAATGWQQHSVRGALAGAIKKRGHIVMSDKRDGERRYRIAVAQ
jgi:hypothetical protein